MSSERLLEDMTESDVRYTGCNIRASLDMHIGSSDQANLQAYLGMVILEIVDRVGGMTHAETPFLG